MFFKEEFVMHILTYLGRLFAASSQNQSNFEIASEIPK